MERTQISVWVFLLEIGESPFFLSENCNVTDVHFLVYFHCRYQIKKRSFQTLPLW